MEGHDERVKQEWPMRWMFYAVVVGIVVLLLGEAVDIVVVILFSTHRPDQKPRGIIDCNDSGFMDP